MSSTGGKSKKPGRNKNVCAAYRAENRRSKNKIVRLRRRLQKHPADKSAIEAWKVHHAKLGKTAPAVATIAAVKRAAA